VQGGIWSEVHLLGTMALDRYRGYVGQSRATSGTHTWNTRPADPGDHGGRLVRGAVTPAEEVLSPSDAPSRRPSPPSMTPIGWPTRWTESAASIAESSPAGPIRTPAG
jgi:hypothetical protein